MDERNCLVFFRIDDSRVKKMVDEFGDAVSFDDCLMVDKFMRELGLSESVYCLCKRGSAATRELKADDRYVVRECVAVHDGERGRKL